MRYLYGLTDDKFVKDESKKNKVHSPLSSFLFTVHPFVKGKEHFDKNALPIVFKVSPDTLLNLTVRIIDSTSLPSVYTWSNVEVCTWVRRYGYPHYQRTFRENFINGRTLLLLDAAALSAMNIKNFDDIRHIVYGIRSLFFFEMTKFARSISLPPHYYYELYKLFRVKSGYRFENTSYSDLWRQMQLIRKKSPNLSHWELLENWLARVPDPEFPELFGGAHRFNLYKCKKAPPVVPDSSQWSRSAIMCKCMPPCECYWTDKDVRPPWRFECLSPRPPEPPVKEGCPCIPPCACHWSPKKFMTASVLTCLHTAFPQKYGELRHPVAATRVIRSSGQRHLFR